MKQKLSPEFKEIVNKLSRLKDLPGLPPLSLTFSRTFSKTEYVQKSLTGIKDVDLKILGNLQDKDLFNICLVNKYINNLCKDEHFWRNRFYLTFGEFVEPAIHKPSTRTWRNHYLKAIFDLSKYEEELEEEKEEGFEEDEIPNWNIFKYYWMWSLKDKPDAKSVRFLKSRLIEDNPELEKNMFYLLNLGKSFKIILPTDRDQITEELIHSYSIPSSFNSSSSFNSYSPPYFTPAKVFQIIYEYYQEPLSRDELTKMQNMEVELSRNWTVKDADNKKIKRIDMMGNAIFFDRIIYDQFLKCYRLDLRKFLDKFIP